MNSPEIYLGHDWTANFSSPDGAALRRPRVYAAPPRLALNQWALAGEWTIANQPVSLHKGSGRFHARDVLLVMGRPRGDEPIRFRVSSDGQRVWTWTTPVAAR